MNRPLVSVVMVYAAGLLIGQFLQVTFLVLFAAAFLLLVPAFFLEKLRPYLLWLLLVLTGWINFALHTQIISPRDLRTVLGSEPALVTMRGELAETPRPKYVVRDEQENWRNVVRVRVSEIRRAENFLPADGEILVTTPGLPGTNLFAGQTVEIFGVIARPPPPVADGLFDFQSYLAARGIYYQLKTESANDWKILEPQIQIPPLTDRFLNWSKQTLALGLPNEDEPLRLLWAMTLGWRTAFTGDIGEPFLRAGTMHMFAIDGLRIALLSGMIVALLRALRLSRAWCGAIAIPTIWFYTAATGWEASAIRASVMMTIVLGGWALKRPSDLLNSLAAAAFIILVWDPRQLFEASFQLSFFVMLIIALMLPPVNHFIDQRLKPDALLPDELVSRRKKFLLWLAQKFARYGSLSFAAWIGSLPLSAKYFHLFSPISTPANILAVPLGTFALMANLGALVCGHWLPWATELFNHAAWFFMVAMTWVSVESAKIPGAYFYVSEPSLATIAIYYAVVIAIFSGWFSTRKRIFLGAVILFFIGGFYFWQWQSARDETTLTILPFNGGHAVFVHDGKSSGNLLVDCGDTNAVESITEPFLHAQGVNHLPRLALTHGDLRNIGGAQLVCDAFAIDEVFTSAVRFRSHVYRQTIAALDEKPGRHKVVSGGGSFGAWRVLYPAATNNFPQADDNSLVLQGELHGVKVLLLSDLGRTGQEILFNQTNDLRADIVVTGLPEKSQPLSDALLDRIHPKIIVVADSEFPATKRAPTALRERLAQRNIPVFYTRQTGAVTLVAKPNGWELRTMDGQRFTFAASKD